MLYSFSFSNSQSFQAPQELNLARTTREVNRSAAQWPDSTWKHDFSTVAAIFGANASGKSCLFRSLAHAVKNPTRVGSALAAPFRLLREAHDPPTSFELRFSAPDFSAPESGECEYHYRTEIAPNGFIILEELRFFPRQGGKSLRVFRRVLSNSDIAAPSDHSPRYDYRWGTRLKGEKAFIERMTGANELFLANSSQLEVNPLEPVIESLREKIQFYSATSYDAELPRIKRRLFDDTRLRDKVLSFIRQADLGIIDVAVSERDAAQVQGFRASLESAGVKGTHLERGIEDFSIELSFTHSSRTGNFCLAESLESDGTRAMLSFASIAIDALDNGGVVIVDEIDTSLHPLLVRELVRQFNTPETNPHQAQLIFTTHDVTLLYTPTWMDPVLDRDQIWFVEKDADGASSLFSVAEFPVRNDENIFRKYLAGQYGGIPHPKLHLPAAGEETPHAQAA